MNNFLNHPKINIKFFTYDSFAYFSQKIQNSNFARCLKITEIISFNIASEASYVYTLSGQKLIKNAKNGPFWRVFENLKACGQTVLPDRSVLIGQKLVENTKIRKISKFKCDILSNFQTMWLTIELPSKVKNYEVKWFCLINTGLSFGCSV